MLTSAQFIDKVTVRSQQLLDINKMQVRIVYKALMDELMDSAGEGLALHGYFRIMPSFRKGHKGRNPKTGEALEVSPRRGLKFFPSSRMRAIHWVKIDQAAYEKGMKDLAAYKAHADTWHNRAKKAEDVKED